MVRKDEYGAVHFGTYAPNNQATRRHIPEDRMFYSHRLRRPNFVINRWLNTASFYEQISV